MKSLVGVPTLVFVCGLPALAVSGYLGVLGWVARPVREHSTECREGTQLPFFTFVVPAHNEAHGIKRTVESLMAVEYPADRFSVLVVADNCSDDTKRIAERAGARVLERFDTERRGKGYALDFGFEVLIAEQKSDGFVVVDADSDVSSNLLAAMAKRLQNGAGAMQANYCVRNVHESWRTRLMDVAFTLYHGVRSTARERLLLSSGLRGNGMGFAVETVRRVPHRSHSLVEDVEYGIELGLHGIRVAYVGEAEVRGDMVASGAASESQRRRWEQGRRSMISRYLPTLLGEAIRGKNWMLLDLALDLMTPPLTSVVLYTTFGTAVAIGVVAIGAAEPLVLVPWLVSVTCLTIYLARGVQMSSQGTRALTDLLHAPKYAFWKMLLRIRGRNPHTDEWVRTSRKDEGP